MAVQVWQPNIFPEYEVHYDPETEIAVKILHDPDFAGPSNIPHRDFSEGRRFNGKEVENPQAVFDLLASDVRRASAARTHILANLPSEMMKLVVDSDGDPVLDEDGNKTYVIKDKHEPKISIDRATRALTIHILGEKGRLAHLYSHLAEKFRATITTE